MGPQFFVDGGFVCTYKGITRLLGRGSVRITPAHAGKRLPGESGAADVRDHPRTRGEKAKSIVVVTASSGSPPHTRGKGCTPTAHTHGQGITPAHAGKSLYPWRLASAFRDHPRTRGEKGRVQDRLCSLLGSPPHTRGKAMKPSPAESPPRDHPRTRGEKAYQEYAWEQLKGSPPHTRGKVKSSAQVGKTERITPAHAGKSGGVDGIGYPAGDHPRTRGEKGPHSRRPPRMMGSPPHTRGKD